MKCLKSILPAAVFLTAIIYPSCEKFGSPDKDHSGEPAKIDLTGISEEILEADKAFGFELFRQVYGQSEVNNIMISPLSVSYALGMTYNGADSTTLQAFEDVLHFDGLTTEEINESYRDLMDQLVTLDDNVEFSIANSIWYRLGFEVLAEFIATNREYFDAGVQETDFSDPATLELINQWIEDKTNGKIRDMLDYIPADAVMYLINAIYFNAAWKYQFEKEDTYEGDFTLPDGSEHRADFMVVSGDFAYTSNEDFAAVELPYGNSTFSMVVMLPNTGNTVSDLVEKLDAGQWDSWFENPLLRGVRVEMPKFKYEFKGMLNDPLINLGLGVAFQPGEADFSGINPEKGRELFISRVIHQTFIDVQEEGTEAAAATIVEISVTSNGGGGGPIMFRVDRPFLYVIKENSTGAIVFTGTVGKPEYS